MLYSNSLAYIYTYMNKFYIQCSDTLHIIKVLACLFLQIGAKDNSFLISLPSNAPGV